MGAKVSKSDKVIEQRFNELKSMASDVSNFIDNYEGENLSHKASRKHPFVTENNRQEGQKASNNLFVTNKLSLVPKDSEPVSEYNRGSERDLANSSRNSPKAKKGSAIFLFDNIEHHNFDPLTPNSFLKQSKGRIDEEVKNTLQTLINKQYVNLMNVKVYLHSEIPLDDEKPMEEKSCKIEDRSKDQGFGDYESPTKKFNFDAEEAAWDVYENSKQHFYELGIAVTCRKGEATDVPNQDNYLIYVDAYTKVYSVYDGHGPYGNLVSHFVCLQVAKFLLEGPIYLIDPVAAIKDAFAKAESALKAYVNKKNAPFDIHLSGTSATVVVQRSNVLYIGQLGDSKVMIGRKNKNKKGMTLEQLTYDHVPYSLEEKKRIYAKGGEVRVWDENGDERVFAKGRVYPCLATTRAIGDEIGSLIGIISEPEICTVEINPATDVFLLIGSSPVFTYLDDNEILNVMNYANVSKIRETVDILVKKAKNAWINNENTVDDLTLIITYLENPKQMYF